MGDIGNFNVQDLDSIIKKQLEYRQYIKEHVDNVNKSFLKLMQYKHPKIKEFFINDSSLVEDVCRRCLVHDKSKLSYEEFEPYRRNFYPINKKEKDNNKEAFEKAWEHHWKNNDHHWENRQDTEYVNLPACVENIIDWMAMGIKFGNTAYDYYDEHKEEIHLNDNEREYMETILYAMKEEDTNEESK